jgi:hypothetical protein
MQIRIGLVVLASCGLAVTACTASGPKGPDANVTIPAVGKPPAPTSAQAALASEAFTPYAGLGAVSDDGLAPGETYRALHTACMNAAGYGQYAADVPFAIRANRGLALPQAAGPWGYVGVALAQQYGFATPDGNAPGPPPNSVASLPLAAAEAGNKCFNITLDFNSREFATSLAGIETMNNEVSTDVIDDAEFKKATTAWSKCMAKNGYTAPDPDTFAQAQQRAAQVTPGASPAANSTPTPSAAQIAMAVTDAQCTLSTDLAGIYFAVQADYEQQFVTANQQALNLAVRRYKADYAKELRKLPGLLRAAANKLAFTGPGKRRPSKPSATP